MPGADLSSSDDTSGLENGVTAETGRGKDSLRGKEGKKPVMMNGEATPVGNGTGASRVFFYFLTFWSCIERLLLLLLLLSRVYIVLYANNPML